MGHRIIIVESATPPAPTGLTSAADHEPDYKIRVEYRPGHNMTSAQIGHEVARINRKVDQIIDGTAD